VYGFQRESRGGIENALIQAGALPSQDPNMPQESGGDVFFPTPIGAPPPLIDIPGESAAMLARSLRIPRISVA